jgi:hypothetical protein
VIERALWLLALCVGCGTAPEPEPRVPERPPALRPAALPTEGALPGVSRPPDDREMQLIRTLMRDTERIRGLAFREQIDIRIQDSAAMRGYVSQAIDEEVLARSRRRYVALGLLAPDIDVRELLESVMEEELIGYYDPKLKRLAVRDDVARSLGGQPARSPAPGASSSDLEWRATVVHELVHALQDQHLGLGKAIELTRTTDADDAFGALVEGDATLAMLGYAAELSGVSLKTLSADPRGLAATLHVTPERLTRAMRDAPAILREPLLFRYREGTLFAAKLYGAGGWEQVDAAHLTPPESTRSVTEPAQYLAQEATPRLTLPDLSWLASAGYERVDEDVLGGFEISIVLREGGVDARTLQRGWRGDRYAVLERKDAIATTWFLCLDTKGLARRVATAFEGLGTHGIARRVSIEAACLLVTRGLDPDSDEELARRFREWAKHD